MEHPRGIICRPFPRLDSVDGFGAWFRNKMAKAPQPFKEADVPARLLRELYVSVEQAHTGAARDRITQSLRVEQVRYGNRSHSE